MPEVQFHPLLALLVAYAISSIMSVGGISGAFLLLPFQVSVLGFTGPAVTPTNHLYNVVAIPSGVYRYCREGHMLWPLAAIIVAGTLPGVIFGSLVRIYLLANPRSFKVFMGCVLIFMGGRLIRKIFATRVASVKDAAGFATRTLRFDRRRLEYTFQGAVHGLSVPQLVLLSVAVGVIGGAYGVGGGAIIAPFLVSVWNLPVQSISGAALFGTFLTSVVGVTFFWFLGLVGGVENVSPNWLLGLWFGVGGLLGTYTGARLQRYVPPRLIEALLSLVAIGLGLSYVGFFLVSG